MPRVSAMFSLRRCLTVLSKYQGSKASLRAKSADIEGSHQNLVEGMQKWGGVSV